MLKNILSGALLLGLMVVSATSNAEILVNHHGHAFQESKARHPSHHRAYQHGNYQHQRYHYRSYAQHSNVVIGCLRIKNGQHYRVC
jgi:hypothetical protein